MRRISLSILSTASSQLVDPINGATWLPNSSCPPSINDPKVGCRSSKPRGSRRAQRRSWTSLEGPVVCPRLRPLMARSPFRRASDQLIVDYNGVSTIRLGLDDVVDNGVRLHVVVVVSRI